mgnify:CR=1 FL=1
MVTDRLSCLATRVPGDSAGWSGVRVPGESPDENHPTRLKAAWIVLFRGLAGWFLKSPDHPAETRMRRGFEPGGFCPPYGGRV